MPERLNRLIGEEKCNGIPLFLFYRSLWIEFPGNIETFDVENEYMLGKQVSYSLEFELNILRCCMTKRKQNLCLRL